MNSMLFAVCFSLIHILFPKAASRAAAPIDVAHSLASAVSDVFVSSWKACIFLIPWLVVTLHSVMILFLCVFIRLLIFTFCSPGCAMLLRVPAVHLFAVLSCHRILLYSYRPFLPRTDSPVCTLPACASALMALLPLLPPFLCAMPLAAHLWFWQVMSQSLFKCA